MIQYINFKQYTQITNGLRFPIRDNKPFMFTYFSENSTLIEDFPKLNLKVPLDVRIVIVPRTILPRTFLTSELKNMYKSLNLYAYPSTMKIPNGKSFIYDITNYNQAVDLKYNPSNYRQRAGLLIKNQLNTGLNSYQDYKKVLIYSVDSLKPSNQFINRKLFSIVQDLKENDFYFDDMLLAVLNESSAIYRLLVKNKTFNFAKIYGYLKNIKYIKTIEDEIEVDEKDAVSKVMDILPKEEILPKENKPKNNKIITIDIPAKDIPIVKNKEKIEHAVTSYLKKDKESTDKILSGEFKALDLKKIAIKSILFKSTNDIHKSNRIINNIKPEKVDVLFKAVNKQYGDQLLQKYDVLNTAENQVVKSYDIKTSVDNKTPDHLFNKRQIDFKTNLKTDLVNSFKTLETKDIPLKIEKISIVDKPDKKNEIEKSDLSVVQVTLKDEFGKKHEIAIDIPKIDPNSGTFRVNGKTKCLINQMVLCPISFLKAYDSKFESSFSTFHIYSKRTKRSNSLMIYMGSFKNLSLLILLSYSFGFDSTLKQYGIEYKISTEKPPKSEKFACKINETEYIYFTNINSELKMELITSFINEGIDKYKIIHRFGTLDYFNDLIIKMTGRVNSTYLIKNNLENIVDPVAKQVLINKGLPSDLKNIMQYMASKVVEGFHQDRNDISNQRIRGSEILVHLAQKQILSAYTVYKEQVLAGNKNAEFTINRRKTLSAFINSEIVTAMEYANPIEEMSVMTRISPVGKGIGGIADVGAIQNSARNVNPSYFGNIDPLDTPEGPNIGVIQQLSVDAMISSARGLFTTRPISNSEGAGILSTSSVMVPFISNNEGARVILSDQQVKQMLPLKNPTPPIVRSGYESILTSVLSDNFIKKAPEKCKVLKIEKDKIVLIGKSGKRYNIDLNPIHLKSGTGRDTLSIFNVKVVVNQVVESGQIVAEGSCIKDGSISLGKTLCVGFMPYKGYNFEDSIVINEKLVADETLTSLHGIETEVIISEKDRVLFIENIGTRSKKGEPILRKTMGEIEELIGFDDDDDTTAVHGQELVKNSPGGIIVDIEVFCNIDDSKFPKLKPYIDKTRKKYGIIGKQKFTQKGIVIKGALVKFKIEQELEIEVGDKLCNRHGNKGMISLIEKDENMPRTPWGDRLDIILNPLGVIGRMNPGQLFELYCGLISKALAIKLGTIKDKKQFISIMNSVLSKLDVSKNKEYTTKMINSISKLSKENFSLLVKQIKDDGFVPIIIPPFKSPKENQIMEVLKLLKLETGYNLYLPEYGVKTKHKVPVGYMYISKLEHMAAMKIHARSTGPSMEKTGQPTSGKQREGGQRLGEADVQVLISYNCPKLVSELMGPLSDDKVNENAMIAEIIQTGDTAFRVPKLSPTKDLLNSYFVSLMLENK